MIRPTKGKLGANSTVTPEMINNAFYNSPLAARSDIELAKIASRKRNMYIANLWHVHTGVIYD